MSILLIHKETCPSHNKTHVSTKPYEFLNSANELWTHH